MSAQHTPTPVKGDGFDSRCGGFMTVIIGNDKIDAQEVVRMVRAQDELVAVLREYHERLNHAWQSGALPANVIPSELAQRATAALAKAGAE